MATTFSWATPAALSSVLTGTNLNALANNTCKLSSAVTVGSNPPLFTSMLLNMKTQSNVTNGTVVAKGWFAQDCGSGGSGYDQAVTLQDGTTTAPSRAPDFIFQWQASGTAQLGPFVAVSVPYLIARPADNFKVLLQNTSGQTFTANNTDNTLQESTRNEYGA